MRATRGCRIWRAKCYRCWRHRLSSWRRRLRRPRSNSWPGTRATPSASAWRAFRASALSTAIAATVVEPSGFRSGREFAAWLDLVPRQNSTGGKHRLGGISKRGNQYLRRLLINGASANLLRSKATKADPWVIGLRRRRPPLVVAVALANKTARIAWAVMLREKEYQPRAMAA